MIGAGVVGHWDGPNQRNLARPAEYIKVDRDTIHLKNGRLSFRLMEPMEEAVYLDQVKVLAVDHPRDFEVWPNEYFASNPPFPAFRVIQSQNARLPAAARDEHGHDLMPDLRAHKYFGDFELLPFHGFTKTHSLELDLGAPYGGGARSAQIRVPRGPLGREAHPSLTLPSCQARSSSGRSAPGSAPGSLR